MTSRFHTRKQQRTERAPTTAHGNINLVPLVDILTSIVFFSLLTYTGESMAALTAFDLSLPPVVITAEEAAKTRSNKELLNLIVTVRVDNNKLTIDHSEGLHREIAGVDSAALNQLQVTATEVRTQFPQNSDITVIPSDDVNYENVVHVLERLKMATFKGIALGTKTRQEVAPAGGGAP
ncbi:MAG: biopolymer transporter ExbD [Gemmatimonadota bacterium]|nr:biopolymer transporter ExbD [Gemmatimonadota bacterium]MDQ6888458.1 biopolymer transporter ExbD [Gemmatimonadota bacterium]